MNNVKRFLMWYVQDMNGLSLLSKVMAGLLFLLVAVAVYDIAFTETRAQMLTNYAIIDSSLGIFLVLITVGFLLYLLGNRLVAHTSGPGAVVLKVRGNRVKDTATVYWKEPGYGYFNFPGPTYAPHPTYGVTLEERKSLGNYAVHVYVYYQLALWKVAGEDVELETYAQIFQAMSNDRWAVANRELDYVGWIKGRVQVGLSRRYGMFLDQHPSPSEEEVQAFADELRQALKNGDLFPDRRWARVVHAETSASAVDVFDSEDDLLMVSALESK